LKWLALIPLRGGSRAIPKKNIKELGGKPLFAWSLEAAIESGCFDKILVATDNAEIATVVGRLFEEDKVTIFHRSPESATDEASTEIVMAEVLASENFDVMATIQATSPLTRSSDFKKAQELFLGKNLDSLFTGVLTKSFFWTIDNKPLNYDFRSRPRRQDHSGTIQENGAFYFTSRKILSTYKNRLGGFIGHYLMPHETLIELDEPSDLKVLEDLIRKQIR